MKIFFRQYNLHKSVAVIIALGALAWISPSIAASGDTTNPTWRPKSSEKLIKLPANYLKKSLDHDFQESPLGLEIQKTEEESSLKKRTLADLHDAIHDADGDLKLELRHQFLAEKRQFLELMSKKNKLRSKHLNTKRRLFERMMKRMAEKKGGISPVRQELVHRQNTARTRFESSLAKVDIKLFQSAAAPQSKYTVKYAENMAAIEKLVGRIQGHKMNSSVHQDGQPLTKEEYIRQLLTDTQAELAVVEQEETILGYMAKLVALDALAVSEQALDAELADSDTPSTSSPAKAVEFFLTN